jgi:hypothetical protein
LTSSDPLTLRHPRVSIFSNSHSPASLVLDQSVFRS